MREIRLNGPRIDDIVMAEAVRPEPGPGQILVRIRAASLNYRDLLVLRGYAPRAHNLVPLSDGAGEVVAVGAGVTRWKEGTLVAGCFFPHWQYGQLPLRPAADALGGGVVHGVLSEFRLFGADQVVAAPTGYSAHEAATLPCAALTAWNALAATRSGETVLILGTGGVSSFALQFAKAAGARVIATSSRDDKIARLRAMGADATINYREEPEWDRSVLRETGGRGVDRVVEIGGAVTLPRSLALVRPGGEVALMGALSNGTIDPRAILASGASVRGVRVGSREMFEAMNRVIAQHGIRPVIDRVFPLYDVSGAYRHLESANHVGKVVIDLS